MARAGVEDSRRLEEVLGMINEAADQGYAKAQIAISNVALTKMARAWLRIIRR